MCIKTNNIGVPEIDSNGYTVQTTFLEDYNLSVFAFYGIFVCWIFHALFSYILDETNMLIANIFNTSMTLGVALISVFYYQAGDVISLSAVCLMWISFLFYLMGLGFEGLKFYKQVGEYAI